MTKVLTLNFPDDNGWSEIEDACKAIAKETM